MSYVTSPTRCHSTPVANSTAITRGPKSLTPELSMLACDWIQVHIPIRDQSLPIAGCAVAALFVESGIHCLIG